MKQKFHVPPDIPNDADQHMVPTLAEVGLDQFAPYLLNRITNRWNSDLLEVLRRYGLTTRQMRTLAVLSTKDGCSINELATLTVTEQSTMSRALVGMEEMGFIVRKARSVDARFNEVHLTAKGRQTFKEFWPAMYWSFRRLFHGVDEQEFHDFNTTLQKILNNIRRQPF